MSNKTASYIQIAVCIWIIGAIFLWINFERSNLISKIICVVLLFAIPIITYLAYKFYIPYKTTNPIKWPTNVVYPYRIEVPFQCTVQLKQDNLQYNNKGTFFRKKVLVTYSSIKEVSAYVQTNIGLGGAIATAESIAVKYTDLAKEPLNTKSEIYILTSWMNKYDYSVLIKTLREKCPTGAFDESLLKDFGAEE